MQRQNNHLRLSTGLIERREERIVAFDMPIADCRTGAFRRRLYTAMPAGNRACIAASAESFLLLSLEETCATHASGLGATGACG